MKMFRYPACSLLLAAAALCQPPGLSPEVVHLAPLARVTVKPGETVKSTLSVHVDSGYHANSNTPADPFLIPMQLTWAPGPLTGTKVAFPKPQTGKFEFSKKPVSIFTDSFDIVTTFHVAADAAVGEAVVTGKLHYQACNDHTCLTPKSLVVSLPVEIVR